MNRFLFYCGDHTSLGAMAEGLARHLFGHEVEVVCAGSVVSDLHPQAVTVMSELGIDISSRVSLTLSDLHVASFDLIVSLCADDGRPMLSETAKRLTWSIDDPAAPDLFAEHDATVARFRAARDQLQQRLKILHALTRQSQGPAANEFHASVRVTDLARSAAFYAWLFDCWPKEWTHRYATFARADLNLNFVLLVADGRELHRDTLYHLGVGVPTRAAVIDAYQRALAAGLPIEKPPRTTWKGTPLHELWLTDPDGNLIEIYARLTEDERAQMPVDRQPVLLCGPAPCM